jgi:serine/threonine protein kinase
LLNSLIQVFSNIHLIIIIIPSFYYCFDDNFYCFSLGKNLVGCRDTSVDKLDGSIGHGSNTDEDYSDDGDEGTEGYKFGGYHPVSLGDKFNARYTVVEKLGWGHFSTVWMCWDKKAKEKKTPEFIALKIQKSAAHYREAALDEIELLACSSSAAISNKVHQEFGTSYDPCVVLLLNHFDHNGPNGRHVCMTFEMLGDNLLKVIKKYDYRGIPIPIVKNFVRQILVGLDFLHRHCSIIHTDLKPENILISTPPPTPSMEVVKKIIIDSNGGNPAINAAKAGGSTKKKKKNSSALELAESVELSQNELATTVDGIILTAEERKKMKKKDKKKKQQARKNESKKEGSSRRGGKSRRKVLSPEKEAAMEMMLMERDSVPRRALDSQDFNDGSIYVSNQPLEDESCAAKARISSTTALNDDEVYLEAERSEERGDSEYLKHLIQSLDYEEDDEDIKDMDQSLDGDVQSRESPDSMPSWLRHTLFGFLNFSTSIEKIEGSVSPGYFEPPKISAPFERLISITKDEYVPSSSEDYARISLIAPVGRLMQAFNNPTEYDIAADSEEDLRFAQWYFELSPSTTDPSPLHFSIKGCGEDTAGISALMSYCTIDVLIQQPDVYSVQQPLFRADRPVLWHIEHRASETGSIVRFLENLMPGVFFLAHFDLPEVITEEDDADLLYMCKNLSVLPDTIKAAQSSTLLEDSFAKIKISEDDYDRYEHKKEEGKWSRSDGFPQNPKVSNNIDKNEIPSSSSSKKNKGIQDGRGLLLGIDLDSLSDLVFVASMEMGDEVIPERPFFTESSDLRR